MKIVETTIEASEKASDSINELAPTEKWLFEIQNGNVNLFTLFENESRSTGNCGA